MWHFLKKHDHKTKCAFDFFGSNNWINQSVHDFERRNRDISDNCDIFTDNLESIVPGKKPF